MAQVWTLVVGGLVAAGGAMGYAKARSVPSLVAGVTCGALYGLSTLWMEPYQIGGNLAAVVISIVLAVAMGRRFLASGKVMPGRCLSRLHGPLIVAKHPSLPRPFIEQSFRLQQVWWPG